MELFCFFPQETRIWWKDQLRLTFNLWNAAFIVSTHRLIKILSMERPDWLCFLWKHIVTCYFFLFNLYARLQRLHFTTTLLYIAVYCILLSLLQFIVNILFSLRELLWYQSQWLATELMPPISPAGTVHRGSNCLLPCYSLGPPCSTTLWVGCAVIHKTIKLSC